jgi:hypothetical protein
VNGEEDDGRGCEKKKKEVLLFFFCSKLIKKVFGLLINKEKVEVEITVTELGQ